MCRVLNIHRSGYYAWLKNPESKRAKEDKEFIKLIKHYWVESEESYGSPRIFKDFKEAGITIGENRIARLMKLEGIKGSIPASKHKHSLGVTSNVAKNHLNREFNCTKPNQKWVTDITYIRTLQGFAYLAVVVDLYSRKVVGWSVKNNMRVELVLDALLMAIWRRQPSGEVLIHTDQGSQFGSDLWIRFCKDHNLKRSMSRRGNCWDNSVVESFFNSLKKDRVKRVKTYKTIDEARSSLFDYIEFFYNPKRRHDYLGGISPNEFEKKLNVS